MREQINNFNSQRQEYEGQIDELNELLQQCEQALEQAKAQGGDKQQEQLELLQAQLDQCEQFLEDQQLSVRRYKQSWTLQMATQQQ